MKKLILIPLFFGATNLFAQQQDSLLVKEIPIIKSDLSQQQQSIKVLTKELNKQNHRIEQQSKTISSLQTENKRRIASMDSLNQLIKTDMDSLNQLIKTNRQNIISNSKEFGTKIQDTEKKADSQIAELDTSVEKNRSDWTVATSELGAKIQDTEKKADSQIAELGNSIEKNQLYWIIATLGTLLLAGLIYWLLGKRITSSKSDVETQIRNTKASLEEESVKLDNKLVEVLETQLKLQQETSKSQPVFSNEKTDYSLALKVADEIIRIQKNLGRMDEKTKGLKQLNSSVKRIQDNFASNGYELVDMLGKEYNEEMKATVNFVQDEDFDEGKRIITRIIKPQVNYKGVMIQSAQIEVTEA